MLPQHEMAALIAVKSVNIILFYNKTIISKRLKISTTKKKQSYWKLYVNLAFTYHNAKKNPINKTWLK